jgi:predicted neuraminidase
VTRFDDWKSWPVVGYRDSALAAEEPYWWVLPDGSLVAMFRDNRASGFLFRSFSRDHGRTWTMPVRTNFPDAASKFSGLQLRDGRYVLVSNPHPGRTDPVTGRRDPLALAISDDGLVFHSMGYLVGGRHVDYPHVIEHDGFLLVAFATEKQTVEVLKIKLSELDSLKNR